MQTSFLKEVPVRMVRYHFSSFRLVDLRRVDSLTTCTCHLGVLGPRKQSSEDRCSAQLRDQSPSLPLLLLAWPTTAAASCWAPFLAWNPHLPCLFSVRDHSGFSQPTGLNHKSFTLPLTIVYIACFAPSPNNVELLDKHTPLILDPVLWRPLLWYIDTTYTSSPV